MESNKDKIFMWYDSDNRHGICYGPHYYGDEQKIGKRLYHNLDELLQMNVSDSLKKRLVSAKPGTKIKVHRLHSNGDLMLKRLNSDEVESVKYLEKLHKEYNKINQQLGAVEDSIDKVEKKLLNHDDED